MAEQNTDTEPIPAEIDEAEADDTPVDKSALWGAIIETGVAGEKIKKGALVYAWENVTKAVDELGQSIANAINPEPPAFQVFKLRSGRKGWIARHTGKFVDRHDEILADKAHDEYVDRVTKGFIDMPELWTFHTKGTKHGEAFAVWREGGFTLAAGLFDETPEGEHAFAFYQKHAGEITLSHGFYYPTSAKREGVYYAYNTFEISTLLRGEEAFPYTSFEEIEAMALTDAQKERIREVGGESMLKRAEAASEKALVDTKTLEGNGVAYKGHDNFEGATLPDTSTDDAVKAALGDFETRLKELATLPETVKALQDGAGEDRKIIAALHEQVTAAQNAEAQLLEQVNGLQKQLAEYAALKPPASQSDDTLLNEREKSYLDQVMTAAKAQSQRSLIDTLVGGQTTISPNGGNE